MPLGVGSKNSSPMVDLGHPALNHIVHGFVGIAAVGLVKAAIEEAWHLTRHGKVSKSKLEHSLKKTCKEGALWGTMAAVYLGMEYAVGMMRGTSDWKNATIGGALAGAVVSAVANRNNKDRIAASAITGGALATAAVFLN